MIQYIAKFLFCIPLLKRWWIHHKSFQIDAYHTREMAKFVKLPAIDSIEPTAKAFYNNKHSIQRILFIGNCMWEHEQLFPELRRIANLDTIDLSKFLKRTTSQQRCEKVYDGIKEELIHLAERPDLVFLYASPNLLSTEVFKLLRDYVNVPLIGMNLDERGGFLPHGVYRNGNDNYRHWAQYFDLNLTSSLPAIDWYRQAGANAYYMPQGFCRTEQNQIPPFRELWQRPFSFMGSWKPERQEIIESLLIHDIPITIYGKGWNQSEWASDANSIYRSSMLNLGIGYTSPNARIANPKGRDIECPGAGGCYITTYQWELHNVYDIGKEILCYRNQEELIEMLSYYLRRPHICLEIAKAGHAKAHQEHTWEMRFRPMLRQLGFNA